MVHNGIIVYMMVHIIIFMPISSFHANMQIIEFSLQVYALSMVHRGRNAVMRVVTI